MTKHFINGVEVTPRNLRDIGFTNSPDTWDEMELNLNRIILPNEGRDIVQSYVAQKGYGHGIPYTVIFQGIVLQYYIDPTDNLTYRDTEVEVTIKKRKGKGSFFERATGMTFEQLSVEGVVFPFINAKYVIVKDNQAEVGITLALGVFSLTAQLAQAVKDLAFLLAELANPLTAPSAVVKTAIQIVYVSTLLVALITLSIKLKEFIFPSIREFKTCYIYDLIEKSCQHLGWQFQSNLLTGLNKLAPIPVPFREEKQSIFNINLNEYNDAMTKGYPTANDTVPTLDALIKSIEVLFNAETRVINGVVRIETEDFWQQQANVQLTGGVNLQDLRENERTFNTDELWVRYYINYLTDVSDVHTIDKNQGTTKEMGAKVISLESADLNLLKGLIKADIPYAFATRKSDLSLVEELALQFFEFIDAVINFFGGSSNTANLINQRLGCTQVSQQYFNRTKLAWLIDGKQPENYLDIIGAPRLWTGYHFKKAPNLNGKEIIKGIPIPISEENFINLLENNFIFLNGELVKVIQWEYIPDESKLIADIERSINLGVNVQIFDVNG